MRLIGAGFGRTGSLSTKAALERLGFGPCHHMVELLLEDRTVADFARAGRGERVDWTQALADYEACVDWPACAFWEELAETFPAAKILLTVRDPELWYDSVENTIWPVYQAAARGESPLSPEQVEVITNIVWGERGTFRGRFEDKAWVLEMFAAHNAAVQAAFGPERLLVHDVKEGWAPLCAFLDVPVPDEPFPRLNDRDAFPALFEARK